MRKEDIEFFVSFNLFCPKCSHQDDPFPQEICFLCMKENVRKGTQTPLNYERRSK